MGFSGDGGPATNASLNFSEGGVGSTSDVAVDTPGNLYIADAGNQGIRKVSRDGIITTATGNGIAGSSGDGGLAVDVQSRLVDAASPARAGEVVQVFCTGLGATNPRVPSGEPAPAAEPLARVVAPVEAHIGGRPATVHFAGLAPGFVGLYQVNVEIPAGVEASPEVPLVLFQQGVPSNTVTLAIR